MFGTRPKTLLSSGRFVFNKSISNGYKGPLQSFWGTGERSERYDVGPIFNEDQQSLLKGHMEIFSGSLGSQLLVRSSDQPKKIYGWGRNIEKQLSSSNSSSYISKKELQCVIDTEQIKDLLNCEIISASGGAFHTLILLSDNSIVGLGANHFGELGSHTIGENMYRITELRDKGYELKEVFAGEQFSAALTNCGKVFTWGRDRESQLGWAPYQNDASINPVDLPYKVEQFSLGWGHCLAICDNHKVFSWGSNIHHQLGHSTNNIQEVSVPSSGEQIPIQVRAGGTHSMMLVKERNTEQTHLYIWGSYKDCKLGFAAEKDQTEPFLLYINELESSSDIITHIDCGCDHSVVVTRLGKAFGWGFGQHGALGFPSLPNLNKPTLIPTPGEGKVEKVLCSLDDTLFLIKQ